jgi:hypothetical protein
MTTDPTNAERRSALRLLALSVPAVTLAAAGCNPQPRIYDLHVFRDAGCMCCHAWAELMKATGRFHVSMTEGEDLQALKQKLGVPVGFGSCHTAQMHGYVIEGHVPAEDILRLIEERHEGVRGLAVPGMPRGSPGMEQPDGSRDAYDVFAFKADGSTRVFVHHE